MGKSHESICVLLAFMMSLYLSGFVFISRLFCFHFLVLFIRLCFFLPSRSLFCLRVLSFLSNFLCPLCLCLSLSSFFLSVSLLLSLSCDCATRSRLGIVLARHWLISPLCRLVSEKCGGWRNCHTYFNNHHGISIAITILPCGARARSPLQPQRPINSHILIAPVPSAVTLIFSHFTFSSQ